MCMFCLKFRILVLDPPMMDVSYLFYLRTLAFLIRYVVQELACRIIGIVDVLRPLFVDTFWKARDVQEHLIHFVVSLK